MVIKLPLETPCQGGLDEKKCKFLEKGHLNFIIRIFAITKPYQATLSINRLYKPRSETINFEYRMLVRILVKFIIPRLQKITLTISLSDFCYQ